MPRRAAFSSILLFGAASPLTGQASAQETRMPAPTYEQTRAAVAACGVPAANVRFTYEDELQSDLVRISDLGRADEALFRCMRGAVDPAYIVWIEAEDQRIAYHKSSDREDRRRAKAEAVPWLKERGMLGRVPRFDPGVGVGAFARGLETACAITPGRALEANGASGITIKQGFFGESMTTKMGDDFTCLTRVLAASNADEYDIFLGFIGNAAASEDPR